MTKYKAVQVHGPPLPPGQRLDVARGDDLTALVEDHYGIRRLDNESDMEFRRRVVLAIAFI